MSILGEEVQLALYHTSKWLGGYPPVPGPGIFTGIFVLLQKSFNMGNHPHSCKFVGKFFVPAKIPGHGTGPGQGVSC